MAGLATCTLTHMTELAASRNIIRALIGGERLPAAAVRIGLAPSIAQVPPATPAGRWPMCWRFAARPSARPVLRAA